MAHLLRSSTTAAQSPHFPFRREPPAQDSKHESVAADNTIQISKRLFWLPASTVPRSTSTAHYFSVDYSYVYEPFFADFGPLNLGHVYRYCQLLEEKMNDRSLAKKKIIHTCSPNPHSRPNAAFLICAYQMVVEKKSATDAFRPFSAVYPPFLPFRDATYGICTYRLTVLDCLKGLEFAMGLRWFDRETFDIEAYEHNERVEHGDLNWIIPNKFIAFSGPSSQSIERDSGILSLTPEHYIGIFRTLGVKSVIRLNKKQYDRRKFIANGVRHHDLYFLDGSCPSWDVIKRFIDISEAEPGAIAVHCKAGLGRTGTLIGCYAIKNYRFPAAQWIGWNRICRPGSILGPQQHFLLEIQTELQKLGVRSPPSALACETREDEQTGEEVDSYANVEAAICAGIKNMSVGEKHTADHGDLGQGERLCKARRNLHLEKGSAAGTPSTATPSSSVGFASGKQQPSSFEAVPTPASSPTDHSVASADSFSFDNSHPPAVTTSTIQGGNEKKNLKASGASLLSTSGVSTGMTDAGNGRSAETVHVQALDDHVAKACVRGNSNGVHNSSSSTLLSSVSGSLRDNECVVSSKAKPQSKDSAWPFSTAATSHGPHTSSDPSSKSRGKILEGNPHSSASSPSKHPIATGDTPPIGPSAKAAHRIEDGGVTKKRAAKDGVGVDRTQLNSVRRRSGRE